jgi:F-type H+-transporting ATPase subunit delta
MAELATIARPYAEAVFALADAAGTLSTWSQWLGSLAAVANQPQIQELAGNPNVSPEQVYGVVMAPSGGQAPAEVQNFVRVLIENRRLSALPEVRAMFEVLRHEREGVVEARIESAFPVEQDQLAKVVADLERRFKRKVNPTVAVSSDLIGGVRVTVGDEVIDASVRGKLDQMSAALKS